MISLKEKFIEKAKSIHNDKFDYSEIEYSGSTIKIKIICNVCKNYFSQEPRIHLNKKRKCPFCNRRIMNQSLFEERSKSIFSEHRFNYSKCNYINSRTKVTLICNICNEEFLTKPSNHFSIKTGCSYCGNGKRTFNIFVNQAKLVHNNIYGYIEFEYKNENSLASIICKKHGVFNQKVSVHLSGSGCSRCVKILNINDFIDKAERIHSNTFNYSKVDFINCSTKVLIRCSKNHEFYQTPSSHLSGNGCKFCANNCSSKIEHKWLDIIGVPLNLRNYKINIKSKSFNVDGYNPNTRTIYEFNGDFWHGNLDKYNPNDVNVRNKKTFKELNKQTILRELLFKSNGFTVISIWESDFKTKYKEFL